MHGVNPFGFSSRSWGKPPRPRCFTKIQNLNIVNRITPSPLLVTRKRGDRQRLSEAGVREGGLLIEYRTNIIIHRFDRHNTTASLRQVRWTAQSDAALRESAGLHVYFLRNHSSLHAHTLGRFAGVPSDRQLPSILRSLTLRE